MKRSYRELFSFGLGGVCRVTEGYFWGYREIPFGGFLEKKGREKGGRWVVGYRGQERVRKLESYRSRSIRKCEKLTKL